MIDISFLLLYYVISIIEEERMNQVPVSPIVCTCFLVLFVILTHRFVERLLHENFARRMMGVLLCQQQGRKLLFRHKVAALLDYPSKELMSALEWAVRQDFVLAPSSVFRKKEAYSFDVILADCQITERGEKFLKS
ncbi:MAG: hypothetical protein WCT18_00050 [Patescibacteria group bacterium]